MSEDPRIEQLLDELLDAHATPEEVCAACPELLPAVRNRWRQLRFLQADLDALFPPDDPNLQPGDPPVAPLRGGLELPRIPGYEVEAVLGRGGMGVVFRARHLRLGRAVALKMMLAGAYAGQRERDRFQHEAEAVARLRHANVVQIHDIGDVDGRPYFTMELVDGGSLAQKLAGTPQPIPEATRMAAVLAGAVHAAHACGIIHRDLKPANVLLAADGTPKISDFGLSRRLDDGAGWTQTGVAIGTPSYMSPEQARGRSDQIGPAADVYALGALLYELLTGRPPFKGASAAETLYQVTAQDPVPPALLNPKVPRDLQTICLKCLCKEPAGRYASAAALADDLGRYLRGEAIAARPEGRVAALVRRIRQRKGLSAALATCALLVFALTSGTVWYFFERAATRRVTGAEVATTERAATDDLAETVQQLKSARWPAARAALDRARARLGGRGSDDLHQRLDRAEEALKLGLRLDEILMACARASGGGMHYARADEEYEEVFRAAGFGQENDPPEAVAARIAGSDIRSALIDSLDNWARFTGGRSRREWLMQVARRVDPNDWRDRARDPAVWADRSALERLVADAPVADPCVPLFLFVAYRTIEVGMRPFDFLERVRQAHPSDFWVNLHMGDFALEEDRFEDAIRYYYAALVLRPDTMITHNDLGMALVRANRFNEALPHLREAKRLDPTGPNVHRNLARALWDANQQDEALELVRTGLKYKPASALLHTTLANFLEAREQYDQALAEHLRAVECDAGSHDTHQGLRRFLVNRGRFEEALGPWRAAIALKPDAHAVCYGYAELCAYLGREDWYREARRDLLGRFGTMTEPGHAERTARACLLLPVEGDERGRAVALAELAGAQSRDQARGTYPYYQFVRGLADFRQGRFEPAMATMRGDAAPALGPAPRLVLAMALHQSGKPAQGRNVLAEAIRSHDWSPTNVRDQDGWIYHVLRREAERLILPELPAFLEGTYEPKDNDERFAMLGACQFANRTRATARLYAGAFAASPQLAADLRAQHRYHAARTAAQAGCGHGTDAPEPGATEGKRWRDQAREWLRAELAVYVRAVDTNPMASRAGARQRLSAWRVEPALACVRDPGALDKLPEDEQKEYRALWADVAALFARTEK
jgi:serine/threonine-protein kinase